MIHEAAKNLKLNGLLAQVAMSGSNPEHSIKLWNDYVSLELGYPVASLDKMAEPSSKESDMMAEYAKIKHLRPKIEMDKRGFYVVSGMNI